MVDLGFSWLCICHLPKWHMISTYVWASSAFIFIIVWVWHFYPLTFVLFYSAENKRTTSLPSRSFIPLPRFICSRRPTPFPAPWSLLPLYFFLSVLTKCHMLSVSFIPHHRGSISRRRRVITTRTSDDMGPTVSSFRAPSPDSGNHHQVVTTLVVEG